MGVGLAPGGSITETGYAVHNVLIGAWFQAGILGLLGISLLLGFAITQGLGVLKQVPRCDRQREILTGIVGSLAAALVMASANPILYQRYFWIPIAMVIAARAIGQPHPVDSKAIQVTRAQIGGHRVPIRATEPLGPIVSSRTPH